MARILAVVIMATLCIAARAADKAEDSALNGSWKWVSGEYNGAPLPDKFIQQTNATVTVAGGKWTDVQHDKQGKASTSVYDLKVDATASPKQADLHELEPEKGQPAEDYVLIYEVSGDTLKVCSARPNVKERPTEFKSGDNRVMVRVYTRVKP